MQTRRAGNSLVATPLGPPKVRTGIEGLDEITSGGLPRGKATLLLGGPGSGKTVLALQTLVHGAAELGEPGIFVTFEEDPVRLAANAAGFGWNIPSLQRRMLHFIDARPSVDLIRSGEFDLIGMLAAIEAKARAMRARWIVFDSIDMVLALLPDPLAVRREMLRLHDWLLAHDWTSIVTAKQADAPGDLPGTLGGGFLQFMVDCAIALDHRVVDGVSLRSLRVIKYRGSRFAENEAPLLIADHGVEVAGIPAPTTASAPTERITSGVARLDTMLGGGYYRGSSVLVTGAPGTAKTTLAGAFAEAACARGEQTLFISFDSEPADIVRNLRSVGIHLAPYRRSGLLHLLAAHTGDGSAEVQYLRMRSLVRRYGVRCVVIDPISALGKQGAGPGAFSVVERLVQWIRREGVSLFCTSLTESSVPDAEGTPLQISTIADSWIHLSYRVHAGERNRALTIIKSRGTSHSNQVRELLLSDRGITLADVFTAGGEVLMGTLRWEHEAAVRDQEARRAAEASAHHEALAREEDELMVRVQSLERELAAKRAERAAVQQARDAAPVVIADHRSDIGRRRLADLPGRRRRGTA